MKFFELIFAFFCFGWELVQKARIQIWLFEQRDLRIEGRIIVCFMSKLIYAFFLITAKSLLVCRLWVAL